MIAGLSGSLLSSDALERLVPDRLRGELDEFGRGRARRRMRSWHVPVRTLLGPASSPRTVFDRLAAPLFADLGYDVVPVRSEQDHGRTASATARLDLRGTTIAVAIVTAWGQDATAAWRDAVQQGIAHAVRWCFCLTGPSLRVVDAIRTYSRRYFEIDLARAIDDEKSFALLWGLLRAEAMHQPDARRVLDRAVVISEEHRAVVRSSLQDGVQDALGHLRGALLAARRSRRHRQLDDQAIFDESLLIVYRILFLLFAEARGLVPRWHPTYRDGYTIESLRGPVELTARPRGVWEALQSISRLAHRGCRIGPLRVTAFNGHLFSPVESPLADSLALDDGAVRQALLALTTRASNAGRQRISYGDLGVEQLGGVYERLLDVEPGAVATHTHSASVVLRSSAHSERRKRTGSFYTPRTLTEYLVRRTLAPIVHDASSEQVLAIRVLDPAMGSGAFLVAACRYLAATYESALLREGALNGEDIGERERAGFRRAIAQRCLYGVDLNPTAVQLGRLSLWLATLSADRPLTFLDHRLRAGNSLVGAGVEDLARGIAATSSSRSSARKATPLPLFDDVERDGQIRSAIAAREAIALEPGDTLAQVRGKEQALARLMAMTGSIARWKSACDVWCASWFAKTVPQRGAFAAVLDGIFDRTSAATRTIAPLFDELRAVALQQRFFHWPLEFPEVFHSALGGPDEGAGFDAIVGNPPWEMLRADRGCDEARSAAKADARSLTAFTRGSGIYRLQGDGHANLYQVFLERMLMLLKRGGRFGIVMPWNFASDLGAAHLRRRLLERTAIDTFVSIDNRDRLFPIHRSIKFLLVCATTETGVTDSLPCRLGIRAVDQLDRLPERGSDSDNVAVPRSVLERSDPVSLAIPDLKTRDDLDLLSKVVFEVPALGDTSGWNVHFGRELNASDDRHHFARTRGRAMLPVIEGKHVTPFAVAHDNTNTFIGEDRAAILLDSGRTFARARLAYREVASATNKLTLIAAIVPARVVTTHTLFCLKESLDADSQLYLCGMFNSFVANYLIRLRVTTHVTASVIARLPLPRPAPHTDAFRSIVRLAASLCATPAHDVSRAELQARAAHAYGLDRAQFDHVLSTFPLVPDAERAQAASSFCGIVP